MPSTEALDDSDLASLLIADAKKSSLRYASQGLSALLPKRATNSAAPKPNTRFLKSLVRDADSHNAKLKEKEESEARERLRKIRDEERKNERERAHALSGGREKKRRRLSHDEDDTKRSRHHRHVKKREPRLSRSPERKSNDREHPQGRRRNTSSPDDDDRDRLRRRRNTGSEDEDTTPRRSRHHRSSRKARSRSRSRSRSCDQERKHRHGRPDASRQDKNPAPPRRSPSPSTKPPSIERNSPSSRQRPLPRQRSPSGSSTSSDPLTSFLGPQPSTSSPRTLKRGRGFLNPTSTSNIDVHFSSTYDPSREPSHDSASEDSDTWASALSALEDRKAYREKQASRLRDAGFTDAEIARWEKSASHPSRTLLSGDRDDRDVGDVSAVKWKKKGEQREWDVGKEKISPEDEEDEEDKERDDKQKTHKEREKRKQKMKTKDGGEEAAAWRRPQNGLLKQFKSALR